MGWLSGANCIFFDKVPITVKQVTPWEWVKIFLPATFVLVDILCTLVGQPKCLRTRLHYISAPFRSFLTLEDLVDPVDDQPHATALQSRVLTALATVSAAGWLALLVFTIWIGETQHAVRCLVCTVSWVRSSALFEPAQFNLIR